MSKLQKLWKTALAGGAGMAALAALNASVRRSVKEPDDSVFGGDPAFMNWKFGRVYFKVGGAENPGPPIVLVHGIGAGTSSFTWRKNFDELAREFRVYALDLLGFGLSEKPASISYSADFYASLISDFIREVAGAPAVIVASSLGAAFSVKAAYDEPDLASKLVLISPTGTGNLTSRPGMTNAAFYGLLQSPVLGTSFYNVVASERSIREYAANQLFFDRNRVTDRFVAHHYATSHQPGAQHAISAFLSGFLNLDIREAFAALRQPVVLIWGREDEVNPPSNAVELLALNENARLRIFDRARMLPHEEHPEHFNRIVREFAAGNRYPLERTASHT